MAERCRAVTKDGKPCGATVVADGMCAWHAPSWEARRRQWSAEGGRKRSNRERARKQLPGQEMSATELHAFLAVVLKGVVAGKLDAKIGNAAANIARSMNEIGKSADLEERMTEIERRLGSKVS